MHAGAPKARGLWFNKCRVCRPAPGVQASGHFYPLSPRYASENRGESRFSMRSLLPCDHAHEPRTGPAPIADAVGLLRAFHLETNGKTSHTTFPLRIAAPAARDWRDTTGILGSRAWVETAADNHLCIFHANSGRSESCEPLPSSFFRCRCTRFLRRKESTQSGDNLPPTLSSFLYAVPGLLERPGPPNRTSSGLGADSGMKQCKGQAKQRPIAVEVNHETRIGCDIGCGARAIFRMLAIL
jgi:hypothetical protein